jgi:hypothetical protein
MDSGRRYGINPKIVNAERIEKKSTRGSVLD